MSDKRYSPHIHLVVAVESAGVALIAAAAKKGVFDRFASTANEQHTVSEIEKTVRKAAKAIEDYHGAMTAGGHELTNDEFAAASTTQAAQ
jgi:hypothetical protein